MYKRGISLISLVITIIVMIILAGISMTAIFGDNGIINQAMKSKERTEYAAAKETLELAWSARMTKFYEDLASGKVSYDAMATYFTADALNELLGSGMIKGDIVPTDTGYRLIYVSESGNSYVMDTTSAGAAEVTELLDEKDISDEAANELLVAYIPKTKVDRVSLYGQGVYTGVSSIVGPTGERVILSTDIKKSGAYLSELPDGVTEDLEEERNESTYNWKVFYIDNNYVYLIYRDYYPNKALLNLTSDIGYGDQYNAYFELYVKRGTSSSDETLESSPKRDLLLNYLNNTSNWSNIVDAFTEEGKTFAGYGDRITAVGGPTLQMWIDSINEKYNDHLGYTSLRKGQLFNYIGYTRAGDTIEENKEAVATGVIATMDKRTNPIYWSDILPQVDDTSGTDNMTDREAYLDGASLDVVPRNRTVLGYNYAGIEIAYGDYVDNLYFPRRSPIRHYYREEGSYIAQNGYVFGYWLLSPAVLGHGVGNELLYATWITGCVGAPLYDSAIQSTRPVVKIPRSIYENVLHVEITD